MICTECKATIADKAIVCYRCGAPTAVPAPAAKPPSRRPRPFPLLALVVDLVAALLVWVVVTATDPVVRTTAAVVAGALFVVSLILIVRRR
jgi:hypothetical protein